MEYQDKIISDNLKNYPERKFFLIVAFAIYVLIWFLHVGDRREWLAAIRIELIWALFLVVLGVLSKPEDGYGIFNNYLFKYVLLFFAVLIIQIPFSKDLQTSWDVFVNRIVKFSFMAWFICMFVRSPNQFRIFIGAFLIACFYELFDTFKGLLLGSMVWENQNVMRLHGMTSLTSHPNSLAGFAIGVMPFVWFFYPIIQKLYVKIFFLSLLFLGLVCLIYSGSRTGYVGFIFLLATLIIKSKKSIKTIILLSFVLLISIPILPGQYIGRFTTIFKTSEERGSSAIKRIEIIEDAVEIFKRYPFGVGISAFPAVRAEFFQRTQDTHNLYLEIATNLGIQGLIVFVVFIWQILKSLSSTLKNLEKQHKKITSRSAKFDHDKVWLEQSNNHLRDIRFLIAVCNATIAYIIVRLSLGLFGHDLYEIYWWFVLGITMATSNINVITEKISYKYLNYTDENKLIKNEL